jgi:hypothetical protein
VSADERNCLLRPHSDDPMLPRMKFRCAILILACASVLAPAGVRGQVGKAVLRYPHVEGEKLCRAASAIGYEDDGRALRWAESTGGVFSCSGTLETPQETYLIDVTGDKSGPDEARVMAKWSNGDPAPRSAQILLRALDTIYATAQRDPDLVARRSVNAWANFTHDGAGTTTSGETERRSWGYNYIVTVYFRPTSERPPA